MQTKDETEGILSNPLIYCTALYVAALNGHKDVVKYISELPIKPPSTGVFEFTSVFLAAQKGNLEVFKTVVENFLNKKPEHNNLSISDAPTFANDDSSNNCNDKTDLLINNMTIFDAAEKAGPRALTLFLNAQIDIHTENKIGYTALHIAALNGRMENIEFLLRNGAQLEYKSKLFACDDKTALHFACEQGHSNTVALLLKSGANIVAQDCRANSPLYYAAKSGNPQVVQILLDKGANINHLNISKQTVLTEAEKGSIIKLLIDKGLNYKNINKDGGTILHDAAEYDNSSLIIAMLQDKYQLNIEDRNDNSCTPLMIAAQMNKCNAMDALLRNKADVNCADNDGCCVIHFAASYNCYEAVKLLLKYKANVNALNRKSRESPLIYAAQWNNSKMVRLLLLYRAGKEYRDLKNKTALDYATDWVNEEIIRLLKIHY